ncbi:thioesterase family protein [Reyranella sp. CPCC 100927]|uniref:acyl-CoA thioesterase n=1 Tax=Reyranella sp. CPCC 100927 TaxID=2599616 RepID=UPI0011B7E513|nr:thioesterase family protein [Reyranella sp. CPCC 100927]TWS99904.1 acyl-CoA thioesterase [Reyranella sp. CPCC 100927]
MNAIPQLVSPAVDLADPSAYGHLTNETLRFADIDSNGHVNNVAFLVLFENARVTYMAQYMAFMRAHGLSTVVAHLDIDFRRQMFFPGTVRVGARLIEVRRSSFVLGQAIFDQEGRCAAEGHAIIVAYDRDSGRGRPIPEDIRHALQHLAQSPTGIGAG